MLERAQAQACVMLQMMRLSADRWSAATPCERRRGTARMWPADRRRPWRATRRPSLPVPSWRATSAERRSVGRAHRRCECLLGKAERHKRVGTSVPRVVGRHIQTLPWLFGRPQVALHAICHRVSGLRGSRVARRRAAVHDVAAGARHPDAFWLARNRSFERSRRFLVGFCRTRRVV